MISGLGADERVFAGLDISSVELCPIRWLPLREGERIRDYVFRMSSVIDTSEPFAICGLSFGGICAQELTRFVNPEKLIILSSVKSPSEMPRLYQSTSAMRLHQIIPESIFKWVTVHSGSVIGIKDGNVDSYKEMLAGVEDRFYKWALGEIGQWKGVPNEIPFLHVHGDNDKVFPSKYIKDCEIVKGGSHLLVVENADQVSDLINKFLCEE